MMRILRPYFTCLVASHRLGVHAAAQVGRVAEHPAWRLVVVGGCHRRRLAGCRWSRWRGGPKRRPIPAGPGACELTREMHGESTKAAVGVCVVVQGVPCGSPAGLLFDKGVRPQRGVGSSQRGVGGGGVEVQDGSPLRGRANWQRRAAWTGTRRDRGQQGVQVTHVWTHCGPGAKA